MEQAVTPGIAMMFIQQFIDSIDQSLGLYPEENVRVVLIIEPDSLPNLVTNMDVQWCRDVAPAYRAGVAYALANLSRENLWLYLDIGHGGWLGWRENQISTTKPFKEVIYDVKNQAKSKGRDFRFGCWAVNVANYSPVKSTVAPAKAYQLLPLYVYPTFNFNPFKTP
ncbi:hypothetical protein HK098_006953 [Nowakowskiella sp. JEL0407]|nr:hypothetical protein HK098_006953 [Nowakowskiella sp. JEL0407]